MDLVVDAELVVRFAHRHIHSQRSEIGSVRVSTLRQAVVQIHHMVVDRRENCALIVIPKRLRVGDDAFIDEGLTVGGRAEPSGRDTHVLVVLESIEVRA